MSKKFFAVTILMLMLGVLVSAQERTGNIYGTVVDNQGNPLPGATVTLTGSRIGKLPAVTSASGSFRFISLSPASDYKINVELEGFKTYVRDGIAVQVGINVELQLSMELGAIEEQVTVTAQTPVVDSKKTTIQSNVNREALQSLPSARDPWAILELASGIMIDRENIGGSESGQQAGFVGRGDSGNNAQWNIDGVNISDPSAVGSSPMYYDFDMFEEMNIQTAGNDVTAMTGGVNINFVTPRGGNKFRGGARFLITDKKFQSDNLPADLEGTPLTGNKVKSMYDYGFNLGGPIVKDKLWFWGSYGVQNIRQININGQADNTDLKTGNFKLNSQLGNHRLEAYFVYNDKFKDGRRRTGGYLDDMTATFNQTGPGIVYKLQDEVNIGQNFFLSAKMSYIPGGFKLDPKGGRFSPMYWDLDRNIRWGSDSYLDTTRDMIYAELTGDYYAENILGVNHEFKFGAEFKNAKMMSETNNGGYQARLSNGVPYEVRYYKDILLNYYANRLSGYVQDIISMKRLTLNLGLRYDRQWGGLDETKNSPMEIALFKNIGGVDYSWPSETQQPGAFPFTWNMFSPRVGLTYDLFGDKRTLLKANFSIYGSQFDATAAYVIQALWGYHRFRWNDANLDQQVQAGELTFRSTVDTAYLADTPAIAKDYFDPNLSPEKTMEILVGVEHELTQDLGVGVNVQYRRMYDFNMQKFLVYDYLNGSAIRQVQNSDWIEAGSIDGQVYWDMDFNNVGYTFTNYMTKWPDYNQKYWAVEFNFKKRLTNKWMMDASFTWQDHKVYFNSRNAYQDPTDHLPVDKLNKQPMAYQSGGSGQSDVFLNSRWIFKLAGLYQFPWGINLSGTFTGREGYISPESISDPSYYNYNGDEATVWATKFGTTRDPNVYLLNIRLEKQFAIPGAGNISVGIDGFNMLNSAVRLARERNRTATNFGQTLAIMSPRIFRLGVRYSF